MIRLLFKYDKKTIIKDISQAQQSLSLLDDEEFKNKILEIKSDNKKIPADVIAVCCEAISRCINKQPFDVQILAALTLCDEKIAEIKTGEGKSLIAVLASSVLAFYDRNIHIMTVNEYLVKRDYAEFKPVFDLLQIKVSYISEKMNTEQKIKSYKSDVVYGVGTEFAFDYLRDNTAKNKIQLMQKTLDFAIVDEADSILIDEARTPIVLSSSYNSSNKVFNKVNSIVKDFRFVNKDDVLLNNEYDCIIDKKLHSTYLTNEGVKKIQDFFEIDNLNAPENLGLLHVVNQSLKATAFMKKDRDYIVRNNEIVLIDSFTGRLAEGKKFSDGLHQAIEAKENIAAKDITKTHASIATASFFDLYNSFAGMTGTIKTEEAEVFERFNKDVVVVKTNKPYIRKDLPDRIFIDHKTKIDKIIEEIISVNKTGQPILVGTTSIEKSKEISAILQENNIAHNLLNASNNEHEAQVIAQAGRLNAITVSTNMAGRGTDILLGGNPLFLTKEKLLNNGYSKTRIDDFINGNIKDPSFQSDFEKIYKEEKEITDREKEKVISLGGLYVLGTEHYDAERIDNQLRGRAGRQGDPGKSQFFVSLEDNILKIYGNQNFIKTIKSGLSVSNKKELVKFPYNFLRSAQKQCEQANAEFRKTVYEFDTANSYQRDAIYSLRRGLLMGKDLLPSLISTREILPSLIMSLYFSKRKITKKDIDNFNKKYDKLIGLELPLTGNKYKKLMAVIEEKASNLYFDKLYECKNIGIEAEAVWQFAYINIIDRNWPRYLDFLNNLKDISQVSSFGVNSPIINYRFEASDYFEKFLASIKIDAFLAFVNMSFST